MAKTIMQILGHVNLGTLVENIKAGIPDPLPAGFATEGKKVLGNTGRYNRVQGLRQTARQVAYGSPAVRRDLKGIDEVDVVLLHFKEEYQLDMMTMQNLRNYENMEAQNLGEQEVARHMANLTALFTNNRIAIRQLVLANGQVNCDASGNLLPSSAGASRTTSFQMAAGNQNQLNVFGAGNLITASWATASTNIPLHVTNVKTAALKLTGYPLELAIYGKNIPSYIANNDLVQPYLSRNPSFAQPLLSQHELPKGLLGLEWIPAYTSFFEDQLGVNQDIIGDDTVIFCPRPSLDWWDNMLGSYPVPNTLDIRPDLTGPGSVFDLKYGMFGFSKPEYEPPLFSLIEGDTMIPALRVPNVVFQMDSTP